MFTMHNSMQGREGVNRLKSLPTYIIYQTKDKLNMGRITYCIRIVVANSYCINLFVLD